MEHNRFCNNTDVPLKFCNFCKILNDACREEREKIINALSQVDWSIPFEGHGSFYVDKNGNSWIKQSLAIKIVSDNNEA